MLAWYRLSRRDLPWRQSTDFYRVWVSEIMLQQTRVETVIPYYHRFLSLFPDIASLAAAPEQAVLAAWSGLGYYSRARSLQRAAQMLAAKPQSPSASENVCREDIRALPGVGDYTAAALASIVFNLPFAAMDGNVVRVVSRLTNDASESSSPAARRRFTEVAQGLLDPQSPGDFNQAMMELGATVCKPSTPLCGSCPVERFCGARAAGTERELPVRARSNQTRIVTLELLLLRRNGAVLLVQRDAANRRLADFWELPERSVAARTKVKLLAQFSHQIVNDRFQITVWTPLSAGAASPRLIAKIPAAVWVESSRISQIPLSTITRKALAASANGSEPG